MKISIKYQMNIKIIYLPKFHCECNPIEMYWAQLKNDFRKNNDQDTNGDLLTERICNSRDHYMKKDTNQKLWSLFERVIMDYYNHCSYKEIMKTYFNSSDVIKSHRRIPKKI
jgi:hypothetical protein